MLNDPINISILNLFLFLLLSFSIVIFKIIFPAKKINFVIVLILFSIIPILSIFRAGTFEAGDLRAHTAQLLDFYYNLKEGVFIPRWSANLCAGFGCPIYLIEYTLPYYFGSLFMFLGFSALFSIKLVLALSFIFSGVTMYLWAKDEFGKVAGFFAAIVYLFTPYHLIDIHFRGSIGEVMSFIFIPLVFLYSKKCIYSKNPINALLLSLSILALILSHSSTTAIILPISFIYTFLHFYLKKTRSSKEIILYLIGLIFGILISAFYWLPAIFEVNNTWWSVFKVTGFRPLRDFIFSPYYLGLLYQLKNGWITPIIGYFQIIFIFLSIIIILKRGLSKKPHYLLIFFTSISIILFIFMQTPTKIIWENTPILKTFIFTYRLLVPLAFINAAIGAILITKIKNIKLIAILTFLIMLITILNWANRKMVPELTNPFQTSDAIYSEYYEAGNKIYKQRFEKRSGIQQEIFKYPKTNDIDFINGDGKIIYTETSQEKRIYFVKIISDSLIKYNTFYFPGWKLYINNELTYFNYEFSGENNFGKMVFPIKSGIYKIEFIYELTKIELISRILSLFSLIIYVLLIYLYSYKNWGMTK